MRIRIQNTGSNNMSILESKRLISYYRYTEIVPFKESSYHSCFNLLSVPHSEVEGLAKISEMPDEGMKGTTLLYKRMPDEDGEMKGSAS